MMSATRRVLWVVAFGAAVTSTACNDEKKPPLTPDGPEMTTPVGSDSGVDMPAPTTPAPPARK
jgi:hypothetical protein